MSSNRRNSTGKVPSRGKDSARSLTSQSSSVADILTVSPVRQQHVRGGSAKFPLDLSGNTRKIRPKSSLKPETAKSRSPRPKEKGKKPAWAIKQSIEDETPRTFNNLPVRPSIADFLDDDEDTDHDMVYAKDSLDNLLHQDSQLSADKSLLEFLSADTERSDLSSQRTEKNASNDDRKLDTDFFIKTSFLDKQNDTRKQTAILDNNKHSKLINRQNRDRDRNTLLKSKHVASKQNGHVNANKEEDAAEEFFTKNSFNSRQSIVNRERNSLLNSKHLTSKTGIQKTNKKSKHFSNGDTAHSSGANIDENLDIEVVSDSERRRAAYIIQTWWRKMRIRRTAGAAAMRRMMQSKHIKMKERLNKQREMEYEKHVDEFEQLKKKEEKARAARQQIIADIHDKGDLMKNKNTINKGKAPTKIKYMLTNGKVSSQTTTSKSSKKQKKNTTTSKSSVRPIDRESSLTKTVEAVKKETEGIRNGRPSTSSSVGRCIDDIFQSSSNYTISSAENTPRTDVKMNNADDADDDSSTFVLDKATSSKKSTSTYSDLLNTLKELEDEEPVTMAKSSQFNHSNRLLLDGRNDTRVPALPSTLLSADKLQSIMSFLDEVERTEDDVRSEVTRVSHSVASSSQFTLSTNDDSASTLVNDNYQRQQTTNQRYERQLPGNDPLDSASQVASDITDAINAQRMEMDEKQRTLTMMKTAMNQQKDFTTMQMKEMDKEHKKQLHIQREDYESTIKRHLSFIDQLIDDKKVLTKRCEDLVVKLKDIDQKYSTKIKQMTESHAVDMKKQKEIMEAAEKLRREKWVKEKTQEIKEITVKGLEPDIQKLIAKHKAEIKKIKAMKQGEVLEADERVGRKYIQQLEQLRSQMEREKEMALRKERENARQRLEGQIREEEESFQQQRRRLLKDVEDEKERLSEQSQQMKRDFEEKKSGYESTLRQTLTHATEDYQKQIEDLKHNHEDEMRKLKEQLDIERQQWIENYMKKQETHLLSKERELKETVREGRDKEIEMVIARLERESAQGREEGERASENRIKRIRDKYENEIRELEHSERSMQDKSNSLKQRVEEIENECIRLRSDKKSKQQELLDNQKVTTRLQEERGKVTDIIRQEFADRLVALEEESKRLRNELSEEKARHKFDVERITNDKEEELDEVHKRVKKAIAKKEETTQLLREQMLAAEKRAEHLEQLLADQRKKILGK